MQLEIRGISAQYGSVTALRDISLTVDTGEIVAILGPSGSGKSTLLQVLAGLQPITSGEVRLGERVLTRPGFIVSPEQRGIGMVFQDFALWPHLTVADTIRFPLDGLKKTHEEKMERVRELLSLVQLEGFGARYPHELSGGQRQRVAIARALANHPKLVLLDEPMASLDARLRETMRIDLARILHEQNASALYVTHDRTEALVVADRVALLHRGQIVQSGSAADIYERPSNAFIAEFLGPVNWIPAEVTAERESMHGETATGMGLRLEGGVRVPGSAAQPVFVGRPGVAMVRPEDLEVVDAAALGSRVWHGRVQAAHYMGMHWQVVVEIPDMDPVTVYHPVPVSVGSAVGVQLRRPAVWFLAGAIDSVQKSPETSAVR